MLGLSNSENYAITIVETVIFTIMNTIMIVDLYRDYKQRSMNLSSLISGHDSRLLFQSYKITIQIVRQFTILFMNSLKLSR